MEFITNAQADILVFSPVLNAILTGRFATEKNNHLSLGPKI
jgi:hypothetical protein